MKNWFDGWFDGYFGEVKKKLLIGGGIALIIIVLIVVIVSTRKPKQVDETTEDPYLIEDMPTLVSDTTIPATTNAITNTSVDIMKIIDATMNENYIIKLSENLDTGEKESIIYRGTLVYGKSRYQGDGTPCMETMLDTDSFAEAVNENLETEETQENNLEGTKETEEIKDYSLDELSERTLADGLIYSVSFDESIEYVNRLIKEGYLLLYQINTSNYIDIYLRDATEYLQNPHSTSGLRIIIPKDKGVLIISEININDINLDALMQKIMEENDGTQK